MTTKKSAMSAAAVAIVAATIGLSGAANAANEDLKATNRFSDATIGFDLGGNYSHVTLSISGPNGFYVSAQSERTAPVVNLRKFGKVEDGRYSYTLSAATTTRVETRSTLDNGRGDKDKGPQFAGVTTSGSFVVKDGTIYQPRAEEER